MKDETPNLIVKEPDRPCDVLPCPEVDDAEAAAFEQGIQVLRKAFEAQRRRVPIEVQIPNRP